MSQWLSSLCMLTESGKEALSYIVNQGSSVSFVKAIAFDPQNSIADADLPKKSTENTLAGYLDITSATGGATPNVVPKVLSPQRALPMTLKARRTLEDSAPYGTAVDLTVGNINFQLNKPTTHPAYTIPVNGFSVKYIGIYLVATGFNESKPFLFQIMKSTLGTDDGYDVISASSLVTFSYSVYLYHTDTLESNQFNISIAEIDTVNGEMLDEAMNELREEVEGEIQGLGGINKTYIASQYSFSTEQAVNYIDLTIQNGTSELPDLDTLKQPMLIIPDFTTENALTFNISNGYAFSESLIRVTSIGGTSNSYPIIIATEITDPAMTLDFYKETIMLIFKEINNVAGYELISLSNSSGDLPVYSDLNDIPFRAGTYLCEPSNNDPVVDWRPDSYWIVNVYAYKYVNNYIYHLFAVKASQPVVCMRIGEANWEDILEWGAWEILNQPTSRLYIADAYFADVNNQSSSSSINGDTVNQPYLYLNVSGNALQDVVIKVGDIISCTRKGASSSTNNLIFSGYTLGNHTERFNIQLRKPDTGRFISITPDKLPLHFMLKRVQGNSATYVLLTPEYDPSITISSTSPSSSQQGVFGDVWYVV